MFKQLKFVALCLLMVVTHAQAVGGAVSVAVRGGSSNRSVEASMSVRGACMWMVPGGLTMINLYALQQVEVVEAGLIRSSGQKTYETQLWFGRDNRIRAAIAPNVDARVHLLAIEERLKECSL